MEVSSSLHILSPVYFPNLFLHFYPFRSEYWKKHFPLTYASSSSLPVMSSLPGMSFLNPTFSLKISSVSITGSNSGSFYLKIYFIFLGLSDQACNNTVLAKYLVDYFNSWHRNNPQRSKHIDILIRYTWEKMALASAGTERRWWLQSFEGDDEINICEPLKRKMKGERGHKMRGFLCS